MRQIIIIGARDRATEIITAAKLSGQIVRGVYDDDSDLWGHKVGDVPVLGPLSQAAQARLPAVMAIADPLQRREIANRLNLDWSVVAHPRAVVERYVSVGSGAVFLEGAVVQPGSCIGAHAVVGARVTVAHDCVVGDFADLAARVQLAGSVEVEEGACLDRGTVVIPCTKIGRWSYLAPMTVVIHDIPDFARAQGMPAKFVVVPPLAVSGAALEFGREQPR